MSLIGGDAGTMRDDADIGIAVRGRKCCQVFVDIGMVVKLGFEALRDQVEAADAVQDEVPGSIATIAAAV